MALRGRAVVKPNGKRGVLPSGKAAVFTVDHQCPECCPTTYLGWLFTDMGFIDGGQDGAYRSYSNPLSVPASPWNVLVPDGHQLKLTWENDWNCMEHNPYIQSATAACDFQVWQDLKMTIDWSGTGELEDWDYEWMFLYVDNQLIAQAHAAGGGRGCAGGMGSIVSNPIPPVDVFLSPGPHRLFIDCTTHDERYHFDSAHYFFDIGFTPI